MPGTSTIRLCPEPDGGRVETGPVQFGKDWPGLFIRGDDCMRMYMDFRHIMEADEGDSADVFMVAQAKANMKHMMETINGQVNLANRKD